MVNNIGKDTVLEGEHGEDQKHQVLPTSIIVEPHVQNGEDEGADVVDVNGLSVQVDNGGSLMGQQGNPEVLMRTPPLGRSESCRGCQMPTDEGMPSRVEDDSAASRANKTAVMFLGRGHGFSNNSSPLGSRLAVWAHSTSREAMRARLASRARRRPCLQGHQLQWQQQ